MNFLKGGVLIIVEEKQIGPQAAEQNAWLLKTSTLHPSFLPDHFPVSALRTWSIKKEQTHGLTDTFKLRIQLHTETDEVPMYMYYICWLLLANK